MNDAPMLTAVAALITAVFGVVRQQQEARQRRREAEADRAADEADEAEEVGRLGLEERQWIMRVAHADNQRLRAENDELRSEVRALTGRLDDLEDRWRETEATNRRLQRHVDRCEEELAALKEAG